MTRPLSTLTDRRSPIEPVREVAVHDDRIELSEDGALVRRLGFDTLTEVRLTVEMAGRETQVVCRASGPAGEIAFGSRRAEGARFIDNAAAFQHTLVALHKALKGRRTVRFVEGQTLGFRLLITGAGALIAAAALVYTGYMLIVRESAILSLIGVPVILTGGALAVLFRPGRPQPYDPDALVKRFGSAG
ncbi:MAG: hypothetical protein ACOC0V_03740 [Oceanicaulis sp.]